MITDSHARSLSDPRRAPLGHARSDEQSALVLEDAIVTLTLLRSPMRLGDSLAELHATVSLLAELQTRLPKIVSAARDQGHSWIEIAAQLGVTAAAARRLYPFGTNTTR